MVAKIYPKQYLILQNCVFSQTFYPNLPIFLHGYIRYIRDISQLCVAAALQHFNQLWQLDDLKGAKQDIKKQTRTHPDRPKPIKKWTPDWGTTGLGNFYNLEQNSFLDLTSLLDEELRLTLFLDESN